MKEQMLTISTSKGKPRYWFFRTDEEYAAIYQEALRYAALLPAPFEASCTTWQTADYCQFFCDVERYAVDSL